MSEISQTAYAWRKVCLGLGNTVTNYVPPKNYLAMLEEGLKGEPKN